MFVWTQFKYQRAGVQRVEAKGMPRKKHEEVGQKVGGRCTEGEKRKGTKD